MEGGQGYGGGYQEHDDGDIVRILILGLFVSLPPDLREGTTVRVWAFGRVGGLGYICR